MTNEGVLTRLEYWNAKTQRWQHGHAGVPLLHPERYVTRLAKEGKVGRATVLETGEVFTGSLDTCPLCNEKHPEPFEGACLL